MAADIFFINQSSTIGVIAQGFTNNATGSDYFTFFIIGFIGLFFLAQLFRWSLETTAILILPVVLVMAAYIGNFASILGLLLIYLGILFAKHFFFVR